MCINVKFLYVVSTVTYCFYVYNLLLVGSEPPYCWSTDLIIIDGEPP